MNSETAVERHGGAVASSRTTATPSEGQALRFWLKLGMISFGGPAGQIAIMHDELVERRCWISERRFLHALNFCMALPGPEAQQLASYIGYSMHGVRGAITAGGLFVLPSFVLICFMSAIYVEYGEVGAVAGIVRGLGAAVIALVAAAFAIDLKYTPGRPRMHGRIHVAERPFISGHLTVRMQVGTAQH